MYNHPKFKAMEKKGLVSAKLLSILILLFSFTFTSCNKYDLAPDEDNDIDSLEIPEDFEYKTTKSVQVNIETWDNSGIVMNNIRIDVYSNDGYLDESNYVFGNLLISGTTNDEGVFSTKLSLPAICDTIVISTSYIGFPGLVKLPITSDVVTYSFGIYEDNKKDYFGTKSSGFSELQSFTKGDYIYLSDYDSKGFPENIEKESDKFDRDFLDDVNASLPEQKKLPESHPQYLSNGSEANINIIEDAEVWITFVHEGAGWLNSLGYFTFPTGSPPQTTDDIENKIIAIPNASYPSSGNFKPGHKLQLQYFDVTQQEFTNKFPAGTSIGWFLVANGWNNQEVQNNQYTHYSIPSLNRESEADLQQHNVLLHDAERDLLLIGFEDIDRSSSGCDQDFNDLIFYTTANPITAINTNNVNVIDNPVDDDGDGVTNVFDDYPDDANKAYSYYYPSENEFGSLVFEDLWPSKGDYDFNDLVLNYKYQLIANSSNQITSIEVDYSVRAIGAGFHNGFGIELSIPPGSVSSVTGQNINNSYISLASNGTENSQTNSVIIFFDDAYNILNHSGEGVFVNTVQDNPYVTPDTNIINIVFSNPVDKNNIGLPPYNPFIIINKNRDKEVHLPGSPPTNLADQSLFGTGDDNTIPGEGKYYISDKCLPWAMNVPENFSYPVENAAIIEGYLVFAKWAESNGFNYMDWYMDKTGYRDNTKLYSHD